MPYILEHRWIEKRKIERFKLQLPATVSVLMKEQSQEKFDQESFDGVTVDICAGGTFLRVSQPLVVGTRVRVKILLPINNKVKNSKNERSLIKVLGMVIRTEECAMAICFDEKAEILKICR